MAITSSSTPNPNALKFSVGQPVGGPATFTPDNPGEGTLGQELMGIDGVVSAFMTADFVTLTKAPDADWAAIEPRATEVLAAHFG